MPFSDVLKLKIKKQSNFTCCWCQDISNKVEVHHIIPQEKNGPDNEDNAAPLCSNCHTLYGNNLDLIKEIKQRRAYWYEICRNNYGKYLNNVGEDDVKNEIPVFFTVLFMGNLFNLPSTLHPTWNWEIIVKIITSALNNIPIEAPKNKISEDFREYHIIDLNKDSWIPIPKDAKNITTDRIGLIHNSELSKFPELNYELKGKAFSKIIGFMAAKR